MPVPLEVSMIGQTVGLVLSAVLLSTQTPNFSGTWEPVRSPDQGIPGAVQTVVQTSDTLTLSHDSSGAGHRFVYKTDGSENHSSLANVASVARVTVKGGTLTIARVDRYADGRIRENTQVWSLDGDGRLTIDSTDGLKGETPTTRKQVYTKRGPAK